MNTAAPLALDFKSATLYVIRLVLHSADPQRLRDALAKRMADAGGFFENEPIVIDASRVEDEIDWPVLIAELHQHRLPPIGVIAAGQNLAAARLAGLVFVELSTPPTRPAQASNIPPEHALQAEDSAGISLEAATLAAPPAAALPDQPVALDAPPPVTPPASGALVITKPLRSGQRIYARHTDLIVIGMVSPGAEVIADGNVHVYGPLRGKAMAGARGDTNACIFTTHLDAELLAVAGVYRVIEEKGHALQHQAALIRLTGDSLSIEALQS